MIPIFGASQDTLTNRLNGRGEKVGLWIENGGLVEAYYKDGLKDGIWKAYSRKTKRLSAFGEFNNGVKSGTWYYFDESSRLILKEYDIEYNLDCSQMDNGKYEEKPCFTSFAIFYYPSGMVKAEGKVNYWKDIEVDYFEAGIWRYYNEQGDLVDSKEY